FSPELSNVNEVDWKDLNDQLNDPENSKFYYGTTKLKIYRASIIPYVKYKDMFFFCLTLESHISDVSDFGGAYDKTSDKNLLQTAVREFNEESYNIFTEQYNRKE